MGHVGERTTPARSTGDGHPLAPYRWWQLFSRSLLHLHLTDATGAPRTWSVDVLHGGDPDGEVRARLYLDGLHHATSVLPASFPVPGGVIEVATSSFGLRRAHHVAHDGTERQLEPDPASTEGRRAHLGRTHPTLSRAVGVLSTAVLVVALVLGGPQVVEQLTQIPPVAQVVGTVTSPLRLPAWANVPLLVVTVVASTERALRLRYNRLLDGGLFDGDE